MNTNNDISAAAWEVLGRLELRPGANPTALIGPWLLETLAPLGLSGAIHNKLLASAVNAAARVMQGANPVCARMRLYTPAKGPRNLGTWGFFQLEKAEPPPAGSSAASYGIDLYLYPEG